MSQRTNWKQLFSDSNSMNLELHDKLKAERERREEAEQLIADMRSGEQVAYWKGEPLSYKQLTERLAAGEEAERQRDEACRAALDNLNERDAALSALERVEPSTHEWGCTCDTCQSANNVEPSTLREALDAARAAPVEDRRAEARIAAALDFAEQWATLSEVAVGMIRILKGEPDGIGPNQEEAK